MHDVNRLCSKLEGEGALVAGVLSGTSADGIDVALTTLACTRGADGALLWNAPVLEAFETLPFPNGLHARVRSALDGGATSFRECALLSRDLGRAFGSAARDVAARSGRSIDLVGSHGQTVYHHDGNEESGAATLQLGDGDFVAEESGAPVVSDFRQRDVAAGGEGAPISALADDVIFARCPRPCAILNLGGMANLTILGREDASSMSFDTGPANALLDGLARRLIGQPCDRDGALAMQGRADARLLAELASHPFFARTPPRSTGRDTFGEAWVDGVVASARRLGITAAARGPADLMATAVELVAACVADSMRAFVRELPEQLIVAGGGVHNRALMSALKRRSPASVVQSDEVGIPADAREGLVFAVLAARFVAGAPVTRPLATGARAGRLLGKLSPRAVDP